MVGGATCLSHLSELREKNPNFTEGYSEEKPHLLAVGYPKRREQLLEGAKKCGMVEIVPEEGGE